MHCSFGTSAIHALYLVNVLKLQLIAKHAEGIQIAVSVKPSTTLI